MLQREKENVGEPDQHPSAAKAAILGEHAKVSFSPSMYVSAAFFHFKRAQWKDKAARPLGRFVFKSLVRSLSTKFLACFACFRSSWPNFTAARVENGAGRDEKMLCFKCCRTLIYVHAYVQSALWPVFAFVLLNYARVLCSGLNYNLLLPADKF